MDKSHFIKEWWESGDEVTFITRPRRFGKTLTMSMLECFFSNRYAGRSQIFQGLTIWKYEKFREMQGTYPVISLSFASLKGKDFASATYQICKILKDLYVDHYFLSESSTLTEVERSQIKKMAENMSLEDAPIALRDLSRYLCQHYGKRCIVLQWLCQGSFAWRY